MYLNTDLVYSHVSSGLWNQVWVAIHTDKHSKFLSPGCNTCLHACLKLTQNTVSAPLQPLIPSQSDTQRLDHQHDADGDGDGDNHDHDDDDDDGGGGGDDGGGDDEDDDDDDDTDNVLVDICVPIF